MVQSVELLLDPAGDQDVRREWSRLGAAGLPTQGRIVAASNRPHITLAVTGRLTPAAEEALARSAGELVGQLPIALILGGLVLFPGRRAVLARSVAPSPKLLRVQRVVAELIAGFAPVPVTLRPGEWTPHVTLARGLSGAELGRAVEVVGRPRIAATAVAIRRWDGDRRTEWAVAGTLPLDPVR